MAAVKGGLEAAGHDTRGVEGLAGMAFDAAKTAALTLVLCVPIVALRTEQDMSNKLILESKWGLVAGLVAAAFFLRLVYLAWDRPRDLLVIGGGVGACAAVIRALRFLANPPAMDPIVGVLLVCAAVLTGLRFTYLKVRGNYLAQTTSTRAPLVISADASRNFAIAGAVFLFLYPWLTLSLVGQAGSLKWIDNFGIQIMIYIMLGWGLNIVVGLAGLLDLGYVAFYAVGAYAYALIATELIPSLAPGLGVWAFWICLPLAGLMAAFWGVLLGFPVLRLRGDYLAIVTLAFGEIIRLVLINWVDFTKGYAGISGIPRPSFFGLPFTANDNGFAAFFGLEPKPLYRTIFLFYVILALALLTNWVTVRLRRLPVGRAWEALREDEIACRSLGINTTNTKLTAFAIGAGFGGLAGSFFAARQGFISPESFTFMESAVILAIVVMGGMGSQIGVAIAAVAMIGGTEILREMDFLKYLFGKDFDPTQYRMLIFGLAMVILMIWKPRGLISTREPSIFLRERKAVSGSFVKEGHG
jgi:branched-chain amino acid transport system permease protein